MKTSTRSSDAFCCIAAGLLRVVCASCRWNWEVEDVAEEEDRDAE